MAPSLLNCNVNGMQHPMGEGGTTMKGSTTVVALSALLSLLITIITPACSGVSERESVAAKSQLQPASWGAQAHKMDTDKAGHLTSVDGKQLGVLKDFVIDVVTGRIVDIVTVLPADRSAAEDHFVAIPWEIVQWETPRGAFVFVGDETVLQQAPHMSRDVWLHQPVTEWTAPAHQYWHQREKLTALPPRSSRSALYKVKDLVGVPVHGQDGTKLGMIAEVGLRPDDGTVAYALIFAVDPQGNSVPTLFRLPWKVLHLDLSQSTVVATVGEWIDI
jgi:sporulation protein YlmC with PRC-barrel domain